MLFNSLHHSEKNTQLNIHIAGTEDKLVSHVETTKYLGVHLDQFLKFDKHIARLAKKIKS